MSESAESESVTAEIADSSRRNPLVKLWKPLALLVLVVGVLILARALGWDQALKGLQPWIESLGPWGPLAFVALYVGASILALPGSVLTLAGGVIFGALWGTFWVSLASTLAAGCCFLIARYFARKDLEASLRNNPAFQKLDALTEKNGVLIVALTRLVPLFPFNLLNYGFGLTKVPFLSYLLTSWLCMLPGTVLYVVGSDAVKSALTQGKVPWHLVGLILLVMALLAVIGRLARQRLKSAENKL